MKILTIVFLSVASLMAIATLVYVISDMVRAYRSDKKNPKD